MVNLNNLFFRIKKLNLNAKKVSDDTGISTGNISDWKSGRSMPTAVKLAVLADYLDCSVDYLLGRTNNPHNESPNLPEIIYKFYDLSEERKQEVLDFIEFKVHQQENDSNS